MKSLERIKADERENAKFAEWSLEQKANKLLIEVGKELLRACKMFPPMNSTHEAIAVIVEEVDELWVETKKKQKNRDPVAIHNELIQIAAMSVRAIIDLENKPGEWGVK